MCHHGVGNYKQSDEKERVEGLVLQDQNVEYIYNLV